MSSATIACTCSHCVLFNNFRQYHAGAAVYPVSKGFLHTATFSAYRSLFELDELILGEELLSEGE